jgi:hypothetical protein
MYVLPPFDTMSICPSVRIDCLLERTINVNIDVNIDFKYSYYLSAPLFSRNGALAELFTDQWSGFEHQVYPTPHRGKVTTASNVNFTSQTTVDSQFAAKCHQIEYSKWLYYGRGYV